uniref:Uncharacterized protein n=1 Tax=Glossina pallidipes TaxID=7398 RepID=A0A1A9Z4M9_GLOPL
MMEVWGGVNTFCSNFGRLKKVSVTTLPLSSSATSLAAEIVSDSEKSQSTSQHTRTSHTHLTAMQHIPSLILFCVLASPHVRIQFGFDSHKSSLISPISEVLAEVKIAEGLFK